MRVHYVTESPDVDVCVTESPDVDVVVSLHIPFATRGHFVGVVYITVSR